VSDDVASTGNVVRVSREGERSGVPRDLASAVLRRSTPNDLESFRECLDAVAQERRWLAMVSAPPLDAIRAYLLANAPIRFVASAAGRVVGWCDVTPSQLEGFRHSGTLGMGLLPAFRGRGLGRALLEQTLAAAREAGPTRIELEVFASNVGAIALYERFGFAHEGRKRSGRLLDGRYEDIVCMALMTDRV
jgi:ribosomal protein S18 acetylase RimI-like enzyme